MMRRKKEKGKKEKGKRKRKEGKTTISQEAQCS